MQINNACLVFMTNPWVGEFLFSLYNIAHASSRRQKPH
jgi:hypothetical protein